MKTLIKFLMLTSSLAFSSEISEKPSSTSLVVYNSNIALVHEDRAIAVDKDKSALVYKGVASNIITDSVNVSLPKDVLLYSQQYRYDELNLNKLLYAHLNKKVTTLKDGRSELVTLLSTNGTSSIVQDNNGDIYSVLSKDIIFKSIPSSLITEASLVWNIYSKQKITSNMSLDYLVNNINFKCDYVLHVNKDIADLAGWLTINNRSGKAYKDTNLKVLAGDLSRNTDRYGSRQYKEVMALSDSMPVKSDAIEGYHIYTIPFKVDIANNEDTQIKFIDKRSIEIEREYISQMNNPNYLTSKIKHSVDQSISFKNSGYELPLGVVRTYTDMDKERVFIGENTISHTPKNDTVKLVIGKAFDLHVSETIIKSASSKNYFDVDILYTVKNSSDETKNITIKVPFLNQANAHITTDKRYIFKDGYTIFNIKADANKEESFKVRFESKK